jgi:hypothetical protein
VPSTTHACIPLACRYAVCACVCSFRVRRDSCWWRRGCGPQLVIMSIEVHADSQGPLLSNPSKDAVRTVVLALHDDTVDPAGEAGVVFILTCDRPEPAAASADPLSPPAAAAAAVPMETDGACASAGKKHPLGALSERQETKWRVQKWLQMYGCHFSDSPGCVRLHVPSEELLLLAFVAAVIEVRAWTA